MKRILLPVALVTVLSGLTILSGCGGEEEAPEGDAKAGSSEQAANQPGFDSPEKVFEACQTATAANDYAGLVNCLSPESQETMTGIMIIPLAMMAAFEPEKAPEIKKLLAKHGVSMDDESEEPPLDDIADKPAFIADVMTWMDENADKAEGGSGPMAALKGTLGKITIDGNSARAVIADKSGESEDIDFVRIDGRWFLHIPAERHVGQKVAELATRWFLHIPAEPEFTAGTPMSESDFDFGDFGGFEDPGPPAPIEAVTLDEFNSAWQVTLKIENQPAGEVVTKLAGELKLKFEPDAELATALQKPVSLDITGRSRFEAIEAVCKQIEVTPVYSPRGLRLEPGARTKPVVFSGPFLIELVKLKTRTASATGDLSLRVFSTGLPPTVLQQLKDGSFSSVSIEKAVDATGASLQRNHGSGGMYSQTGPAVFDREVFIGLKHLLRKVEAISAVEGGISLSLPTVVHALQFDELKPGIEQKAGDVTLKLSQASGGDFTFDYKGCDNDDIQLTAFDKDDKQIGSFGGGSSGIGSSGSISRNFETPPARMEARIVSSKEQLEFPFVMKEIAIPNHALMPEQLAELSFEGDSPVTLEFVKFAGDENFRKIRFRATNHSNKEAEILFLRVNYLDADGKSLEENPTSHSGDPLPAGGKHEFEAAAFFMPDGTKSVKAVVDRVEFSDASEWKSKKQ